MSNYFVNSALEFFIAECGLKELHQNPKGVSTSVLFQVENCKTIALQIKKDEKLKEHESKVPALLLCVSGEAWYEDEKGFKQLLRNGNFINIEPLVKHWIIASKLSQFVLIR